MIVDNPKGTVKIVDNQMHVYAKLPEHWTHFPSTISNDELEAVLQKMDS